MAEEKPKRENLSNKLKEKVFLKFIGKCADCERPAQDAGWHRPSKWYYYRSFVLGGLEIHHIIPVILGGANKLKNLILLCPRCHKARHKEKVSYNG